MWGKNRGGLGDMGCEMLGEGKGRCRGRIGEVWETWGKNRCGEEEGRCWGRTAKERCWGNESEGKMLGEGERSNDVGGKEIGDMY